MKHLYCSAVRQGYRFEAAEAEGRAPQPGDLFSGRKPLGPFVERLVRAKLFVRDQDYLVKEGGVVILSQSTGRAMERVRYQDGLHQARPSAQNTLRCSSRDGGSLDRLSVQPSRADVSLLGVQAIEVKEGFTPQSTYKATASITYHNFFRKYAKVAGMTVRSILAGSCC